MNLTGKDIDVAQFLETQSNVNEFLKSVYDLVDDAVKNYKERDFNNLMVNFGCTGGQHRSVYLAEQLASHFRAQQRNVLTRHRELS